MKLSDVARSQPADPEPAPVAETPPVVPMEPVARPTSRGPEPLTTIYGRVPWALGEKLRDLARERSRATGRRVTVNELVTEALSKLVE